MGCGSSLTAHRTRRAAIGIARGIADQLVGNSPQQNRVGLQAIGAVMNPKTQTLAKPARGWRPRVHEGSGRFVEAHLLGHQHGFRAVVDLEDAENGGQMDFYRALGDIERHGNLLVALALDQLTQYLHLA